MPRYTKRPVTIEAEQFDGYGFPPMTKGISSITLSPRLNERGERNLLIETLEGVMSADIGDFIIKGVKGEFYPCKPDIFEMTYEPEFVPSIKVQQIT